VKKSGVIHWVRDGANACGRVGRGITVAHPYDTNIIKITCGPCCAALLLGLDEAAPLLNAVRPADEEKE